MNFRRAFLDKCKKKGYTLTMQPYRVKQLAPYADIRVRVPASKSILNRALLLSALSRGRVSILCGNYGEDTRAMLSCLRALGIEVKEEDGGFLVNGCGGDIPNRNAALDVGNAGTAARFLPAALAFCGGEYAFTASAQMKARPMGLLSILQSAGVSVEFGEESGHFPFLLHSGGIKTDKFSVDTNVSTQYASGLLLAAGFCGRPVTVKLTGARTRGSYLAVTLRMLSDFGIPYVRNGNEIAVSPAGTPPETYRVEPDISAACYFYALSLLCGARVLVEGVHADSVQGDLKFLGLLGQKGVRIKDTADGIAADGRNIPSYNGFDEDLSDFSDQAMTLAALAAYATMPSILRNLSHIRTQECDRMAAIVENLNALGTRSFTDGEDIFIEPEKVHGGVVKTFGDHRVAMAFALMGLKTGGIEIDDPACCQKTFPDFFAILDRLTA